MSSDPTTTRNEFFKELKPRCVAINDLAVRSRDRKASVKQLISVTEELSNVLDRQVRRDSTVLDDKLADYVFFPLSNILRNQQEFPFRVTELTVKCMSILVKYGWKSKIPPELSQQLLIFLTFIVGGVPGKKREDPTPEEAKLEALRAVSVIFEATCLSVAGAKSLVENKNLPALGHSITVLLDTSTDGESIDIQLEALRGLDCLFTGIKDSEALATFLPGTVSSLSKLLTPPPAWKISRKALVQGIAVLKTILVRVVGDIKTARLLRQPNESSPEVQKGEAQVLTASWLRVSAEQIKLALAGILKLRSHKSEDVQQALEKLCITLLDECHQSLAVCTPILVETAMILSTGEENKSLLSSSLNTSLTDLTGIYPDIIDAVKTTVYNWVVGLPRIMQSGEEGIQQQAIRNLLKGQRFMSTLRIDSSTLNNSLAISLRDSVAALMSSSLSPSTGNLVELPSEEAQLMEGSFPRTGALQKFRPLFMEQGNQKSTRVELLELISKGGSFLQQSKLARDMLDYLRESTGITQIASYWLTFELVKAGLADSSELDEFLDFGSSGGSSQESEEILRELYSFSVTVLNSSEGTDESDWRLDSLALEVTTFTATQMGLDFRPELIDVLYPVATYLGSENPKLREHAMITLNTTATACGYSNVSDLIIENVDYMLNSVSLRLNTLDISPASTQVLRMMIKLTGPRLIPFLDDVVASIFGALDNYHGYPVFVESLFSVLVEIVNQGASSDMLLLTSDAERKTSHQKLPQRMDGLQGVAGYLDRRAERKRKRTSEGEETVERSKHPKTPWKLDKDGKNQSGDDEEEESPGQEIEKKAPKTPTYSLLMRITELTQHYLTSPTPMFRKSLLDLLATVSPALSPDEEAFLPLVNAIWPVLITRLYDPEPFVVIAACKAITALCRSAGDFLTTRFKTEWWDNLGQWCAKVRSDAIRGARGPGTRPKSRNIPKVSSGSSGLVIPIRSGGDLIAKAAHGTRDIAPSRGLGEFAQAVQVWEAVQQLLIGIISNVNVDDGIFEQILDMFADGLADSPEARNALEVINADAVWLAMYERGYTGVHARPVTGVMRLLEL